MKLQRVVGLRRIRAVGDLMLGPGRSAVLVLECGHKDHRKYSKSKVRRVWCKECK
jgi:hypothetical protein